MAPPLPVCPGEGQAHLGAITGKYMNELINKFIPHIDNKVQRYYYLLTNIHLTIIYQPAMDRVHLGMITCACVTTVNILPQ